MLQDRWSLLGPGVSEPGDLVVMSLEGFRKTGAHVTWTGKGPMVVPGQDGTPHIVVPERDTVRQTKRAYREAGQMARRFEPGSIRLDVTLLDGAVRAAAVFGFGQGLYQFGRLGQGEEGPEVRVQGVETDGDEVRRLIAVASQQARVRDWINMPSNLKPPEALADWMQEGSPDTIAWERYDYDTLKAWGAGGIVGVGQGSHRPPVLLAGRYQGHAGGPWVALVGKGITFDSGGISLKPGEGMGRMKGDMGGAAAVMAAIRAVAQLRMPVNVLAVTPLAENLPGGGAFRPGDILTMLDDTTVEIVSTDAEGRLVLADAVTWAKRQNVDAIIDIATLTGANVVALGGVRSGLVSRDEALAGLVSDAAEAMAEPTWRLPHDEDYAEFNHTTAAEIKNSGGRPAGTITAGLFIGHFAAGTPWAHLDIAGLSFEATGGDIGAGATGYGVATLVEVCRRFSAAQ